MIDPKYVITHSNPKSPISEAYRVLRTNIRFSNLDRALKIIVVTSTGPAEGKTTTVSNMAVTFSQAGSRVLLIDADLRKPKLHKVFGLDGKRGLTNAIIEDDNYSDYINKGVFDSLDILTCGIIPPNPSEILSSNAMKKLMDCLKKDYDYVFVDTPPVGTVTDAAVLSTVADGTVLVALSGKVQVDGIKRARELLLKVNANIIGVVLNKLDRNAHGNYYYYYYYYYGENENSMSKKRRRKKPKILEKIEV
jgi:protein-tyrosine kinase